MAMEMEVKPQGALCAEGSAVQPLVLASWSHIAAAAAGLSEASELVTDTFWFTQHGQPRPPLTRLFGAASHSWSGPASHLNQYFLFLFATTSAGVVSPFFVACHCAATAGATVASELVTDSFRAGTEQHGHPAPLLTRLCS